MKAGPGGGILQDQRGEEELGERDDNGRGEEGG